ncbi:rtx toxins ca2+-binding protein [Stylonychia lemnae]|uniref:Rtx toxins ca2+-binding protein n=1 Tax=Stylonychia lemnae TaxID=5949 RepID=A0A078ANI2_STYLE|nr:rtx toxins ca2+-binding protein [Stylonychia lemnae]|eukprot:CDW83895.1 rtx toxins ca2+-binding protein [Stylonychia lemnae]
MIQASNNRLAATYQQISSQIVHTMANHSRGYTEDLTIIKSVNSKLFFLVINNLGKLIQSFNLFVQIGVNDITALVYNEETGQVAIAMSGQRSFGIFEHEEILLLYGNINQSNQISKMLLGDIIRDYQCNSNHQFRFEFETEGYSQIHIQLQHGANNEMVNSCLNIKGQAMIYLVKGQYQGENLLSDYIMYEPSQQSATAKCLDIFYHQDINTASMIVQTDLTVMLVQLDYNKFKFSEFKGFLQLDSFSIKFSKLINNDQGFIIGQTNFFYDAFGSKRSIKQEPWKTAYLLGLNPFQSCISMIQDSIEFSVLDFNPNDFSNSYQLIINSCIEFDIQNGVFDPCTELNFQILTGKNMNNSLLISDLTQQSSYQCKIQDLPIKPQSSKNQQDLFTYFIGKTDEDSFIQYQQITWKCGQTVRYEIKVYKMSKILEKQSIFKLQASEQKVKLYSANILDADNYTLVVVAFQQDEYSYSQTFDVQLKVYCESDIGMQLPRIDEFNYFVGPDSLEQQFKVPLIKDKVNGQCGHLDISVVEDSQLVLYEITPEVIIFKFQSTDTTKFGGQGIKTLKPQMFGQFQNSTYKKSISIVINFMNCLDYDIPSYKFPLYNYIIGSDPLKIDLTQWKSNNPNCSFEYTKINPSNNDPISINSTHLSIFQQQGSTTQLHLTIQAQHKGFDILYANSSFTVRLLDEYCSTNEYLSVNINSNSGMQYVYVVGDVDNTIIFNRFSTSNTDCNIFDYYLLLSDGTDIPSFMSFDVDSMILSLNPQYSDKGIYNVKLYGQLINNQDPSYYTFTILIKKCEDQDLYLETNTPITMFYYFAFEQNQYSDFYFTQYITTSDSGCGQIINTFKLPDDSDFLQKPFVKQPQSNWANYRVPIQTTSSEFDGIYTINVTGKSSNTLQIMKSYEIKLNITSCYSAYLGEMSLPDKIYASVVNNYGSNTWIQFHSDYRCYIDYKAVNLSSASQSINGNELYFDSSNNYGATLRIRPPND